MQNKRPVNLDLFTIKQPLPAIASILHRISGILLFIGVAFMICALDQSLRSEESFLALQESLNGAFAKLIIWALVSALIYHFVAGVKHLLMDLGIGETLEGGQLGAKAVLAISVLLILFAGVSIW